MGKLIPDVSHWVFVNDWDKLNVEFMIAKATQRTNCIDSRLFEFIEGCEAHKIPYWLYCYLEKGNELAQAKYMVSVCGPKTGKYFVGYALDFERDNEEKDILECIRYIESLKEKCLVYGKCALSAVAKTYGENVGFWYARYGKDTGVYDPAYPVKSQYEPYADLHQYTSAGKCPGLCANGDLNRLTGKRSLEWFKTRYKASEGVTEEIMSDIIIGSARLGENGKATGGKVGDQSGKEVSEQKYYTHSKGWYMFRAKSTEHAKKLAEAMKQACNNNNIGYDQSNRAIMTMLKKYGSMAKIAEKTETDCSNLVRGCIYQATGKDVGSFSTSGEPSVLEKSGLFNSKVSVTSKTILKAGDILVTKTKGHTVIVTSAGAEKPTETKKEESAYTLKEFVKDVQKATGAAVDGIAGQETLSKTVTVSATKNRKHTVVKPIQKRLNALGFNCGTVDGIAGAKFTAAVKAFQKSKGCEQDGEITAKAKTWKCLLGMK